MKKKYFVPSAREIRVDLDSCFLNASDPPATGVDRFLDETPTGLDPVVKGGDYGDDPDFFEGD